MKVKELREEAELHAMREAWERLVRESASAAVFLTWEWATAWWSAYGTPGELRILLFLDDSGTLRGIAPLRRQTARRYGQSLPVLSFLGDSSIDAPGLNDSDYLDLLVWRGYEEQVVEAFRRYCRETLSADTVLLLNEIPAVSPNLPLLRDGAEAEGMIWAESDVPCATVQLPATWDEYLGLLQSRFRTKIRSVLRNLENRREVEFRFCTDAAELERVLPVLFDLHTRRWEAEGKPGVFGWDRKRDFYFRLSRLLLERRWLRLSWLEWNGRILACQYGFRYGDTYSQLQEGYEPAAEHWNLGIGLRAWSIREFLGEGIREYDFLGGVGRHKTNWGAAVKQSKRIELAPRNSRTLLFCRGPEAARAARESIRKIVPERILALRHKPAKPAASAEEAGSWLRNAAARAYFHLGLPAVSRSLRERYQLSLGAGPGAPKVAWRRRTEPSARILYYHRVNDQSDGFFDAISPDLFERQVRYLTRHYRVASLRETIDHLEHGDPREMVVAITFDDGYRDNFENALPILRRYGAPATVFLTTGNIDSGRPMWFEELAEAVRTTERESIDLELDIPRRFWMRTLEERLTSNRQLFGLLRKLSDDDRLQWLRQILRQLGSAESSRLANRMLTWDQVRIMHAAGIEFGGHTVTHPFLSKLTPSQAAWEVGECKRRIEQELQQTVRHFAYPNGRAEDFAASHGNVLQEAGYEAAVSTIWGVNYRATDRMALRRGGPWENSVAQFAYKLDWYQLVNE